MSAKDKNLIVRIRLEKLVSEREGMIAINEARKAGGWAMAYDDVAFAQNAEAIRALEGLVEVEP